MSDAWESVAPAVVTSILTTLVTLGATGGIRAIGKRRAHSKTPLVLEKRGLNWQLVNRSRKTILDVRVDATRPEGGTSVEGLVYPIGSIVPGGAANVGQHLDGLLLSITWNTLKRNRVREWAWANVLVKPDSELLEVVSEAMNGGGGK